MPRNAWTGYGRFCPLARALDVVGERWTLVIVQELLKRPSRYSDLASRLPGIGTSVLADRLRKLLPGWQAFRRGPGSQRDGAVRHDPVFVACRLYQQAECGGHRRLVTGGEPCHDPR